MKNTRLLPLVALLFALSPACSDPDDGASGGSAGSSGSSGSSGSGGSDATGPCAMPAGAEVVVPWTKVVGLDGTTTTPAYALLTDGTNLYLDFLDQIVKTPIAGGALTPIYKSSASIPLGFRTFLGADGLVVLESGKWTSVSFSGASSPLPLSLPAGSTVFDVDGASGTVWAAVSDPQTQTLSIVKAGLSSGTVETLVDPQPLGYTQRWFRAGDTFFGQGEVSGSSRPIYVAQKGVAPKAFAVDPPSSVLLGATKNHIYYVSSELSGPTAGTFRAPIAGGKPERVLETFVFGSSDSWRNDTSLYINDASYLVRLNDASAGKTLSPVPTSNCTTHKVLAHEGYVYTVTFASKSGENQVWRIKE